MRRKKDCTLVYILAFSLALFCSCGGTEEATVDDYEAYQQEMAEQRAEEYEEYKWEDPDAYIQSINPDAIPWDEAYEHIGEYITLYGGVTKVDIDSADGNPIFIDIGGEYPDERLTGVIFEEYHSEFPNVESIIGEPVFIEGELTDYNGTPSIKLTDEGQLSVIE